MESRENDNVTDELTRSESLSTTDVVSSANIEWGLNASAPLHQSRADLSSKMRYLSRAYSQDVHACDICMAMPTMGMPSCDFCGAKSCNECFRTYVRVQMESLMGRRLTCMMCPEPVSLLEVEEVCGEVAVKKLIYLRLKHDLRNDPSAAWCPKEGCWRLLRSGNVSFLKTNDDPHCPDCLTPVCGKCFLPSHTGDPCLVPTKTVSHRALAHVWERFHTKKCPSCSVRIERSGGCSQMRCTNCDVRFCWRCRGVLCRQTIDEVPLSFHRCFCPRMTAAMSWITVAGGVIVAAPVAFAATIVAGPPALIVYAVLPAEKKKSVRKGFHVLLDKL